jgi:type VI protein secretion system component VasF
MSLEHMQTTEVKDPAYATIARTISDMAAELKADGHDQETIRQALHVFAQASTDASRNVGEAVGAIGSRRPY